MLVAQYKNGNADVKLYVDGTRVIEYERGLKLEYPLNIDIKVSSQCSFGMNPKTGKAFCSFCHESSTTDGVECDYKELRSKLIGLPKGIELAIGCNKLTNKLSEFIIWCDSMGYIVNLTINQGHIKRDLIGLKELIDLGVIKGLGISYRSEIKFDIPSFILNYEHTVFHIICGVDSYNEVEALKKQGVEKILLLGYKTFGFGVDYLSKNDDSITHKLKEWYWWVHKLFSIFDVVSFDNLALEQLNIKRFFTSDNWVTFNQEEHSMYINAVSGIFSPSSRTRDFNVDWNSITLKDYFKEKEINY